MNAAVNRTSTTCPLPLVPECLDLLVHLVHLVLLVSMVLLDILVLQVSLVKKD